MRLRRVGLLSARGRRVERAGVSWILQEHSDKGVIGSGKEQHDLVAEQRARTRVGANTRLQQSEAVSKGRRTSQQSELPCRRRVENESADHDHRV